MIINNGPITNYILICCIRPYVALKKPIEVGSQLKVKNNKKRRVSIPYRLTAHESSSIRKWLNNFRFGLKSIIIPYLLSMIVHSLYSLIIVNKMKVGIDLISLFYQHIWLITFIYCCLIVLKMFVNFR